MGQGYQERDYEIVDYELWNLEGIHRPLRGPALELKDNSYFSCVGAAQTFGCYTMEPFPMLLSRKLGLASLNLGVAGAGPGFFEDKGNIIKYVNGGRFAVVQIMSGRSARNSLLNSKGAEMLFWRSNGKQIGAEPAYRQLLDELSPGELEELIEETREDWQRSYKELFSKINVPIILFWISVRAPNYTRSYDHVYDFFGKFPQLVDERWIEGIKGLADVYVECVTNRGMPQRLYSRFTGEAVTIRKRQDMGGALKEYNDYYPTPEMHEDTADCLLDACQRYV